jgi:hypothetical protein
MMLFGFRGGAHRAPRLHRVRRVRAFSIVFAVALLAFAAPSRAWHRLPPGIDGWQEAGYPGIRGVTIGPIENSLFPGRGYGTESSAALLDHLAREGVTWVSITPFGRIWDLRSTEIVMDFEAPWEENRAAIRTMVQQAHERGIRVLVIPHLWVETGGWRGEIDPGTPEGWADFQASYRRFVTAWAREAAAAGADAMSIGVECKSWSGRYGGVWRSMIDEVRTIFPGLLTYSANWDEAEDVLFWDQLDLVGINAFYPLASQPRASFEDYVRGAMAARQSVGELAEVLDMPVLFVEVGYTTRTDAAVEPWLWPDGMEGVVVDEAEQARALLASFRAFLPEPWFTGFFVWRYYADLDDVSQEAVWGFSPHGKRAATVLRRVYRSPWGVDAAPYAVPDGPPGGSWADAVSSIERWTGSTVVDRPPVAAPLAPPSAPAP